MSPNASSAPVTGLPSSSTTRPLTAFHGSSFSVTGPFSSPVTLTLPASFFAGQTAWTTLPCRADTPRTVSVASSPSFSDWRPCVSAVATTPVNFSPSGPTTTTDTPRPGVSRTSCRTSFASAATSSSTRACSDFGVIVNGFAVMNSGSPAGTSPAMPYRGWSPDPAWMASHPRPGRIGIRKLPSSGRLRWSNSIVNPGTDFRCGFSRFAAYRTIADTGCFVSRSRTRPDSHTPRLSFRSNGSGSSPARSGTWAVIATYGSASGGSTRRTVSFSTRSPVSVYRPLSSVAAQTRWRSTTPLANRSHVTTAPATGLPLSTSVATPVTVRLGPTSRSDLAPRMVSCGFEFLPGENVIRYCTNASNNTGSPGAVM